MRPERHHAGQLLVSITFVQVALAAALLSRLALGVTSGPDPLLRLLAAVTLLLLPVQVLAAVLLRRGQRESERAAAAVQHRLSTVVATTREWVWAVDPKGRFTYAGPASEQFVGYRPEQLLGTCADDLVVPGDLPAVAARLHSPAAREHGWTGAAFRFRHRNGTVRWVESAGVPLRDEAGRFAGFEGTSRLMHPDDDARVAREACRARIVEVLDRHLLRTAFQPIVSLQTGGVVGVEALSRFPGDPGAAPDIWFADAASVGLGLELEELAVVTALSHVDALPPEAYVSVNVSPGFLASPRLLATLRSSTIDLRRVVVEVTEHTSVSDYTALLAPVAALRRAGVRLAIDDAGAGFASFRHIITLAPDTIKLDRALVNGIDHDPARRALAAAIVMFALDLGAAVVAEGVETQAELDTVALLGMDAAQGWLLANPDDASGLWSGWRTGEVEPGRRVLELSRASHLTG
jgi:PAS domain S-box-containing protein